MMGYSRGKNPNSHGITKATILITERKAWLIEQGRKNPCSTRNELAQQFFEKFGVNIKPGTVKRALNSNGVKLCCKCSDKSRETLSDYIKNVHTLPVGHERKKKGVVYIKVSNNSTDNNYFAENYIPKHRYLWNLWNPDNTIQKNETVVFLDGNKSNFSRENLLKISKGCQTGMNKNKLWSDNPDLTLAAIRYMELNIELRKNDSKWKEKIGIIPPHIH